MTDPVLWIHKMNVDSDFDRNEWAEFFSEAERAGEAIPWGGTEYTKMRGARRLLETMRKGDLVLCYQTDKSSVMGVARVDRIERNSGAIIPHLAIETRFDRPIRIHELKIGGPLERSGALRTQYTYAKFNSDEANEVWRVCGWAPTGAASLEDAHPLLREAIADIGRDEGAETRESLLRLIAIRQGQEKFRRIAMRIWQGTCAVTRCDMPWVLEAAHIRPYSAGGASNAPNCILLRSDIHTLFDLGELSFSVSGSGSMKVEMSPTLQSSDLYGVYDGMEVVLPDTFQTMFRDDFTKNISEHRTDCPW